MSEINVDVVRVNSLRKELANQKAARNRIDESIRRREEALRRLELQSVLRTPTGPQSK